MSGVEFKINGKNYKVSSVDADTSLGDFIRRHAFLPGTKSMCHEGGCGSCIVSVTVQHPVSNKDETFAVNSCLVAVLSCHGWEITTIEGIGSQFNGYHPIQQKLASFNGSQCGFCSPGFVMNMFSLMNKNENGLTMKEVENSFGSNICRCTGFRPIADAFKSFAKDADPKLLRNIEDIEDLSHLMMCKKTGSICSKTCDDYSEDDFCMLEAELPLKIFDNFSATKWFKVYSIEEIFSVLEQHGSESYRLVAGNTAQGVYSLKQRIQESTKLMIDISSVAELRTHKFDVNLILGANMTLSELIDVLGDIYKEDEYFCYAEEMIQHLELVAHIALRNIATIAGNLMIKHKDNGFPSDVFLLLETIGATLTIVHQDSKITNSTLRDFLKMDMKGKIIHTVNLPPLSGDCCFKSYKIMRRSQNDHAIVNAGFLFKINNQNGKMELARIVYGGINPQFTHAASTEKFLLGKNIFKNNNLKLAIQSLSNEIVPNDIDIDPSPEYRKKLAIGLFYKCILNMCSPQAINARFKSGGIKFDRPVSSGKQEYETNNKDWPLNEPMPKVEALKQCAGEATYVNDIPTLPKEVFAAFVLSTVYDGEIDKIDGKDALAMDGVISLLTHDDIPGTNTFSPDFPSIFSETEEILCSGKIKFFGQPVAIIVAETEKIANIASLKVNVTYKNSGKNKPYLKIQDVLKDPKAKDRIVKVSTYEAKSKGDNVKRVIKGSFEAPGQYHYSMETQICICVPVEDGLDVYSSAQWVDWTQKALSEALNISHSKINIHVRRVGGGFGAKISRSIQIATACGVAAVKLNRPVRFVMSLEANMSVVGKRLPCYAEYEVGIDDNGKINYLNNTFYEDVGCSQNENEIVAMASEALTNVYDRTTWSVTGNAVSTDTPSNTWFRGPGTTEGVCMIEHIMDHIAADVEKDPLDVRSVNMSTEYKHSTELIDKIKEKSMLVERKKKVDDFNASNRWRKRGISLMPLRFNILYYGGLSSFVSVFHGDGTVAISHAGIEMGQGINTKVAQVAAHTLGIPIEMVTIKPSSNIITPNVIFTGGSVTSEQCCYATIKACQIILERLKPIKKDNLDWKQIISLAFVFGVNLSAHYLAPPGELEGYDVYGVTVTEVEVDMLTGNHQLLRVDIVEDSGETVNPEIDIGQVEGAFIQGIGYWTCEQLKHSSKTGELLTNRSWNYKTPLMKDIPIDFRIQLLRNISNLTGVTRSKTVGEPPLVMAYSVVSAIRQAIASARKDGGLPDNWFRIDTPLTPENILMASEVNIDQFKLQ